MPVAEEDKQADSGTFFSRDVFQGLFWAVFSKSILILVPLGAQFIAVRYLGGQKYGVFALCRGIADCALVICGLGLNTAIIRFVPELQTHQNRSGLMRLLGKIGLMQGVAVAVAVIVLNVGRPYFDGWFRIEFGPLLALTSGLVVAQLCRLFLTDTFVAMFRVRLVSILSICQGVLWFTMVALLVPRAPEPRTAMLALLVAMSAAACAGLVLLIWTLWRIPRQPPAYGIGKRRVLKISIPSILSSVIGMLLGQYTELIFLGIYFTPALVGVYELSYSVSYLVITFAPSALLTLFTAGFAQAYTKDPNCLGRLISFLFKTLTVTVVPLSALGLFFGPKAIELVYGSQMQAAGPLAAFFFVYHLLCLISFPLSMAIVARERVLNVFPFMLAEIALNLLLDYLLIPRFGAYGGIGAVFGTFAIMLVPRIYLVRWAVGGVYFPLGFFFKFAAVLYGLAALLSPLAPHLNLVTLVALGCGYMLVYIVLIRVLRLIKEDDLAELRSMGYEKLNRVLNLLTGTPPALKSESP